MVNAFDHLVGRHIHEGHGARVAYHFEDETVSYEQLARRSAVMAGRLREAGVEAGDRVATFCGDSPTLVAIVLACWRLGAVVVVGNQLCPGSQLRFYAEDTAARVIVASPLAHPHLEGSVDATLWLDEQLAPTLDSGSEHREVASLSPETPACWQYTQAPDGMELAVVHPHGAVIAGAEPFAIGRLGLRADDRCLSVAKLYFGYGFGNSLVFPLAVGSSAILVNERISIYGIMSRIEEQRPTVFFAVPTFYVSMLEIPDCAERYDLSSVRAWVSAGEQLSAELAAAFHERFGVQLVDGIGSTEMFHIWISATPGVTPIGSLGTPTGSHEVRLLDAQGQPVADGSVGDVWLRGPHNGLGYAGDPPQAAGKFEDGWIKSGDRMWRDERGDYHFAGRVDDMVMVGGQKVVLHEVHRALEALEPVRAARVEVVRDPWGLHKLTGHVDLHDGSSSVADAAATAGPKKRARELRTLLRQRLLPHKCPSSFEVRIGREPGEA
ncbi:MAG: AMP-binding protein [Myxococcota bacterium]